MATTVSVTETGYVAGATSALQTQIDSKIGSSGGTLTGAFKSAVQFVGSGSHTIGSSFGDLTGMANQSVNFPTTQTYLFILVLNNVYPSATNNDDITFQLMIDDVASGTYSTIGMAHIATQPRLGATVILKVSSVSSGSHNIRVQAKSVNGGNVTYDTLTTIDLIII